MYIYIYFIFCVPFEAVYGATGRMGDKNDRPDPTQDVLIENFKPGTLERCSLRWRFLGETTKNWPMLILRIEIVLFVWW